MKLVVTARAVREFFNQAAYYELKEGALAERFGNEVAETLEWIAQHPEMPRLRRRGYRRVNLRSFPHHISYVLHDEIIWVVTIAHGLRRPEHWLPLE
jgi:plasmid stabilization system protein ParE